MSITRLFHCCSVSSRVKIPFKGFSVMDGMAHNMAAANFNGFPLCEYQLSNAKSGNKIGVYFQMFSRYHIKI